MEFGESSHHKFVVSLLGWYLYGKKPILPFPGRKRSVLNEAGGLGEPRSTAGTVTFWSVAPLEWEPRDPWFDGRHDIDL